MRSLAGVGVLTAALLSGIDPGPAHAQVTVWSGPWCLASREGDVLDCGFKSMEQCRQTMWGTAARCYPNTYDPIRSDQGPPKPSTHQTKGRDQGR